MPRANAMVATIGKPSGIAATDNAIATSIASTVSRPTRIPPTAINAPIMITAHARRSPSKFSRFSSGVCCASASLTCSKILPNSVRIPVATTTPRPVPRVMAVPLYTMLSRSSTTVSLASRSVCLCTGNDSPVRVDSLALSFWAWTRRRSAGTRSPASKKTISPGTSSSEAACFTLPPRSSTHVTCAYRRSASMERIARHSVRKPIVVLITITINIATASAISENSMAKTLAPSSNTITMLLNWSTSIDIRWRCCATCSWLRPNTRRRLSASSSSRPRAESTASSCSTKSGLRLQAGSSVSGRMAIVCNVTHQRIS